MLPKNKKTKIITLTFAAWGIYFAARMFDMRLGVLMILVNYVFLFWAWSLVWESKVPKIWRLLLLLLGPIAALMLPSGETVSTPKIEAEKAVN